MKDYYAILGVAKTATQDEIKRAYRRLAHQHHPDKGGQGNGAKFKEINEAYQVLSDPQKRQAYDRFGASDFTGSSGWSGDYEDLLRQFGQTNSSGFGSGFGSIFEDLFGAALTQMQVQVDIRLTQALLGDKISFQVNGEKINLDIPPATQDGDSFRFPGKGGAYRGSRGDLIVVVRIKYPRRLSHDQRRILEELQKIGL